MRRQRGHRVHTAARAAAAAALAVATLVAIGAGPVPAASGFRGCADRTAHLRPSVPTAPAASDFWPVWSRTLGGQIGAYVDGDTFITLCHPSSGGIRLFDLAGDRLRRLPAPELNRLPAEHLIPLPRHRLLVLGEEQAEDTQALYARISLVDLADSAHPVLLQSTRMPGRLLAGVERDGVARVVVAAPAPSPVFTAALLAVTAARSVTGHGIVLPDWTPVSVGPGPEGTEVRTAPSLACAQVWVPAVTSGTGLVTVLTMDAAGPDLPTVAADAAIGAGEAAHVTATRVYVSAAGEDEVRRGPAARTAVLAFDATGRASSRYVAAGSVPGVVHADGAMSEHAGDLRVALGRALNWQGQTEVPTAGRGVAVLRENGGVLHQVGLALQPGGQDTVETVTWSEEFAYFTQQNGYRGFQVFDVTDPEHPRYVATVRPPGRPGYLLPLTDRTALGAGTRPAALRTLDFADPADPKQTDIARIYTGDRRSTPTSTDRFTWLARMRLAIVPTGGFSTDRDRHRNGRAAIIRVGSDGALSPIGSVRTHNDMFRAAGSGSRIAIVTRREVILVDAGTARILDWLQFH